MKWFEKRKIKKMGKLQAMGISTTNGNVHIDYVTCPHSKAGDIADQLESMGFNTHLLGMIDVGIAKMMENLLQVTYTNSYGRKKTYYLITGKSGLMFQIARSPPSYSK